jgi:hypothetical protein
MISATHVPDLLRLSYKERETEMEKTEVVCYIRVFNGRVEVNYSHHAFYGRSASNGPWSEKIKHRMQLEPSVTARMQYMVFHEFWNSFMGSLRVMSTGPEELDSNLEKVRW